MCLLVCVILFPIHMFTHIHFYLPLHFPLRSIFPITSTLRVFLFCFVSFGGRVHSFKNPATFGGWEETMLLAWSVPQVTQPWRARKVPLQLLLDQATFSWHNSGCPLDSAAKCDSREIPEGHWAQRMWPGISFTRVVLLSQSARISQGQIFTSVWPRAEVRGEQEVWSIWLEQPAGALAHSFCSLKLSFLLWNAVEMLSKFSPSFELFITELAHVHAPCTCWYTSLGLSLVNLCFVGLIFRAPDWEPKRVEGKRLFFLFYIRKGLPQLGTYLGNASPLLSHPEQRWKPGLGP